MYCQVLKAATGAADTSEAARLSDPTSSHVLNIHGRLKMRATRYFMERVLRERPYLPTEQFDAILAAPLRRSHQPDGRIRHWGRVTDFRDGQQRVLRLVTRDDGSQRFFGRGYRETIP
jgi:hypothetical protein